jgi:hypothetical protein
MDHARIFIGLTVSWCLRVFVVNTIYRFNHQDTKTQKFLPERQEFSNTAVHRRDGPPGHLYNFAVSSFGCGYAAP